VSGAAKRTHGTHAYCACLTPVYTSAHGRCFCESSVTNLTKDFDYVLDLGKLSVDGSSDNLNGIIGKCTAGRPPPLTPADFREALSAKSFTSKKADEDMVARLYESTFTLRFAQAETLHYASLAWGDAEMATFAKVVASGALDHLTVCWRPTALSPCLETPHVHSPDSEHLFDVPYAGAWTRRQPDRRRRPHRSR
jgi:hypothetical protein